MNNSWAFVDIHVKKSLAIHVLLFDIDSATSQIVSL